MRTRLHLLCAFLIAVTSGVAAQPVATETIEKSFDKTRTSLKLERFREDLGSVPGETRRLEYLYYLDSKDQLVKIRMIESEDRPDTSIKVDDYFFINGDLRLVRLYFFIDSSRLELLRKGSIVPLLTGEHIELRDGKLVRWNALAREIPSTDRRWADKQSSVLFSARVEINNYAEFKKPKQ
jgi:hypothetical protein